MASRAAVARGDRRGGLAPGDRGLQAEQREDLVRPRRQVPQRRRDVGDLEQTQ